MDDPYIKINERCRSEWAVSIYESHSFNERTEHDQCGLSRADGKPIFKPTRCPICEIYRKEGLHEFVRS